MRAHRAEARVSARLSGLISNRKFYKSGLEAAAVNENQTIE